MPDTFRFVVKAQRGASMRALGIDAEQSVTWLTERLDGFGERLGAVLYRVPENVHRKTDGTSDEALDRLFAAWPRGLPLVMEFQHPSWHVDETFEALANAGAALCATELPEDADPPIIRRTGPFLYLRLRRHDYGDAEVAAWAARLEPFLAAGDDAFVFFRHDEVGRGPELARALAAAIGQRPT